MLNDPNLYTSIEIRNWPKNNVFIVGDKFYKWPIPPGSIRKAKKKAGLRDKFFLMKRLKLAWGVFKGELDAIKWEPISAEV